MGLNVNSTCRINQLKHTVKERLKGLFNAAPTWLEEGINCQFLDAQAGGGWKKGKIRLRVEIVLDEPEPEPEPEPEAIPEPLDPDSNFLDSLRKDINSEQ